MGFSIDQRFAFKRHLRAFSLGVVLFAASAIARSQTVPPTLDAELQAAVPGAIVDLHDGYGSGHLNQSPNQQSFVNGSVVYSDDPETVRANGILYQSPVPAGNTRVYLYHVNGTSSAAKITAVLENTSASPATITFHRKSLPAPSGNYISVGKNAVKQYYENTALPATISIPPGAAALLDPALDTLTVSPNQLLSAKYDINSDQSLRVTTLMLPSGSNTLAALPSASVLPGDGFNRQTTTQVWGKENVTPYSFSTGGGIRRFRVGDGASFYDTYAPGFDHEMQTSRELRGNFGITYKFWVNVSSNDGRRLAVLLNPRGGAHAGYVRTSFPEGSPPTGQLVPDQQLNLTDTTKAVVCAKIIPTSTAQTLLIEYMPPGASNLPVHLMLVPYSAPSFVGDWDLY